MDSCQARSYRGFCQFRVVRALTFELERKIDLLTMTHQLSTNSPGKLDFIQEYINGAMLKSMNVTISSKIQPIDRDGLH